MELRSTVFTKVEDFWEERGLSQAGLDQDPAESAQKIRVQVMKLNPTAEVMSRIWIEECITWEMKKYIKWTIQKCTISL